MTQRGGVMLERAFIHSVGELYGRTVYNRKDGFNPQFPKP